MHFSKELMISNNCLLLLTACLLLDNFDTDITTTVSECIAHLAQINHDVKHCLDKNT